MEVLVADVLKSLIVYQIDYEEPFLSEDPAEGNSVRPKSPSFADKIKDGI